MEYTQITLNEWIDLKQQLKLDLLGVSQSFVKIGYTLRKIEEQKLYEQDGYKTITEFAKMEYGIGASTVSRFMHINEKYSVEGYSDKLRPEFADLGSSKLTEMLQLPDEDLEMVRPLMPREAIRELKAFNREEPGEDTELYACIEGFYKDNKEILNELYGSGAIEGALEGIKEIINPAGSRAYRKGSIFMNMYENEIKIKRFGQNPEDLSWERFVEITKMIFTKTEAGANTHQNHFGEEKTEEKQIAPAQEKPVTTGTEDKKEEEKNEPRTDQSTKGIATERREPDRGATQGETEEPERAVQAVEEPERTVSDTEEPSGETESRTSDSQKPEIIEAPFGNRWQYMNTLTEYGAAGYLEKELKDYWKQAEILNKERLELWLKEEVNENGQQIQEG